VSSTLTISGISEFQDKRQSSEVPSLANQFRIADLHDLVAVESNRKFLLPLLDFFIRSYATLHHAEYVGDQETLEDNILKKGNTFRGLVVYSQTNLPVAYAVYYPMINDSGERGNYIEDAYVTESFRGHGVMPFLYHTLAKRCIEEGAKYLQWSTDKRNFPFQGFSRKIEATPLDLKTYGANLLLDEQFEPKPVHLRTAWEETRFLTVPLEAKHVNMVKLFGITPDILRKTGDLDFKGFVTFAAEDLMHPVAITPGWPHMSTFRLQHGLVLEHPSYVGDNSLTDQDKVAITLSIIKGAREYAGANNYKYMKWHLKNDQSVPAHLLRDELELPIDTMLDTKESEMQVYGLRNGKLRKLSAQKKARSIEIPANNAIGARPPERR
jgi:GNAT superfamily N-acetyltransferase